MALRVRRLGNASNIAANTRTRLYAVPAGKRALLRGVHFGNDNGGAIRMGITLNGAGFVWQPEVVGSGSLVVPLATVLNPGDAIDAEHTATNAYTMLQGVEFDDPRPELLRIDALNLGGGATYYTVPAGKRLRVREVVVCPHNNTPNISTYIGGIGHFVKAAPIDTKGIVLACDLSANAGEQIGAASTIAPTHAFYSGVLEDA